MDRPGRWCAFHRLARFADERDENGRGLVMRTGYREPCDVVTIVGASG
jgi:hypothetical protein